MLSFFVRPGVEGIAEPGEPSWVYKGRGDRYFRNAEYGEAITQYKKALIKRNEEGKGTSFGGGYPEVNLKLALIYKNEGLLELAIQEIHIAENKREFLQIKDELYEILNTKAELYLARGRTEDSLKVYEQIIGMDDNWEDYRERELIDITRDEVEALAANLELRKKYGKAYFTIGETKYLRNNDTAAEPYLRMAFIYNFERKKAKRHLIGYYRLIGRNAVVQKIEEYDSILNLFPETLKK